MKLLTRKNRLIVSILERKCVAMKFICISDESE